MASLIEMGGLNDSSYGNLDESSQHSRREVICKVLFWPSAGLDLEIAGGEVDVCASGL